MKLRIKLCEPNGVKLPTVSHLFNQKKCPIFSCIVSNLTININYLFAFCFILN